MKYVEKARLAFLETGTRFPRSIIWAMGLVKYSAARANTDLGLLERDVGEAIMRASMELSRGDLDDKIVVDVYQTGSGTGLNMNVNEVIAERASEILGRSVHPNDHVNMGQSSNDVVPTAIRLASLAEVGNRLVPALELLIASLKGLSERTSRVVKPGRTHLRDALPVTMGQEFGAYVDAFERDLKHLVEAASLLREVPLGGTAVGTGLNTHPEYIRLATRYLAEASKIEVRPARSRFRAMRLVSDMLAVSSASKMVASDLWRLCQDLRLMYSGPFTGLNEIDIPQEVAGSSIMPGKVNPVTVEAAMQAAAQVMGLDYSNSLASLLGELELSMGLPLIGYNVVTQAGLLSEALSKVARGVIARVRPNVDRLRELAESSQALITVISPAIGYDKAAEVSRMLYQGKTVREALEAVGITGEEASKLLDLDRLTKPGIPARELK